MSPTQKRLLSCTERKAQIVAAARSLFARHGFAGTTSAALARACGVSEALIYKLFGSKQGLYEAIVEQTLATWDPLEVEDSGAPLEALLEALARRVFAQAEADPDFVRLLFYSELQGSEIAPLFLEARAKRSLTSLEQELRGRAERGEVRADLDPRLAAATFFSTTWHYATGLKVFDRSCVMPSPSEDAVIETIVAITARGLRP